jgi:hypothetical protein
MNFTQNEIILGIVLALVVYFVVLPRLNQNRENMAPLNTENASQKVDTQQCSRDCCKHYQWPVPHMKLGQDIKDDNVSTNLMCNFGNGGGCVCMKKENVDYLGHRGGNNVA